jgi:hypothetical protein
MRSCGPTAESAPEAGDPLGGTVPPNKALHRPWPSFSGSIVAGVVVILRFAAEALNLAPTTAAAWSSTVGLLLSALYLGGIGPRIVVGLVAGVLVWGIALWVSQATRPLAES